MIEYTENFNGLQLHHYTADTLEELFDILIEYKNMKLIQYIEDSYFIALSNLRKKDYLEAIKLSPLEYFIYNASADDYINALCKSTDGKVYLSYLQQ